MAFPPLESLDADFFQGLCGDEFDLPAELGNPRALVLGEVRVLGHRRTEAAREPFALTFRGSAGLRLPQGTYRLDHAGYGSIEMFLVQLADKPDGSYFEAIFT